MRAWLYTGPIGHLVAGLIDWLALLTAYLRKRAGDRLRRRRVPKGA